MPEAPQKDRAIKLVFESGPLVGTRYRTDVTSTIGRDVSNSIVVPDPSVSLVHCEIRFGGGNAVVTDLGSTNGTLVNRERIVSRNLSDGDVLTVGESSIRVEIPHQVPVPAETAEAPVPEAGTGRRVGELAGSIFGSVTYLLKRKIADGGMGAVYEAEQFGAEGFIKKVAIKTILPSYAKKPMFVSAFIGEAKLVANLVHQNIVQIHHLGRHEGGYYIAMEYIDGVNLSDFIRRHRQLRRRVPTEVATFIVSRICHGLEYAHGKCGEKGQPLALVHRDVSPNNIMITHEGEVKLTDFGVAKAAQFMEDDQEHLVGTVEYMSPEQAACREIDARSDIFALGLVYYELLTGLRVFRCRHGDIEGTAERVKNCDIPDPSKYRIDLSEDVRGMLMRCLLQDPAERFQSAGELGNAFEHDLYSRGHGPTVLTLSQYMSGLKIK